MLVCPSCNSPLKKAKTKVGFLWVCRSCNGRAVAIEVLRKVVPRPIVNKLWQKARSNDYPRKRHCPACSRLTTEVPISVDGSSEYIDVCTGCHFIWFDPGELESMPRVRIKKPNGKEKVMSMAERELLARARIEAYKHEQEAAEDGLSSPDHWWEVIIALFGIPIEYNSPKLKNLPIVTWLLAAAIAIVSIASFSNIEEIVNDWGLIPAYAGRHLGLTFATAFFLHAGILHLIGNLGFLLIFGDNTEDVLGPLRFLLLIALATFVGSIIHVIGDPGSTVPCVGASGGISGILAYYCLRFPQARFGMIIFYRWIRLPAGFMLIFWFILQSIGIMYQVSGFSNVSALSHIGGAFVGIIFWLITKLPSKHFF